MSTDFCLRKEENHAHIYFSFIRKIQVQLITNDIQENY